MLPARLVRFLFGDFTQVYLLKPAKKAEKKAKAKEVTLAHEDRASPYTTPSMDILRLYRKLGGEIITIGSDSHAPKYLGAYEEEAEQILKSLGFRYICTFDERKPIYHRLDR